MDGKTRNGSCEGFSLNRFSTGVWTSECGPFLAFVTPKGPPRLRTDPLSPLCTLFIHSFPLLFHTLTLGPLPLFKHNVEWRPPSPLLWWVTDEWSDSLKSRVTARLVKREEMRGQKTAESEVEGKERNGGRGKNMCGGRWRGSIQQERTSNGETSIKSVRECVCGADSELESMGYIFAWVRLSTCIMVQK